ncbi:MAG: isochorismatase family protein [Methylobacteriaceae bacterium]|nr:isochorismatase family protein [Methylobacteriaceae bacterium]
MALLAAARSVLLVVDFQARLTPAIEAGEAVLVEAKRLIGAARLLDVPVVATEQNPQGLGGTVPGLLPPDVPIVEKHSFDAARAPALAPLLPAGRDIVLCGCEAHVCVLQTAFGLIAAGRRVAVVADAVGSRKAASKAAALARLAAGGADVVTAEMAIFEWLGEARHPRFREALALVR